MGIRNPQISDSVEIHSFESALVDPPFRGNQIGKKYSVNPLSIQKQCTMGLIAVTLPNGRLMCSERPLIGQPLPVRALIGRLRPVRAYMCLGSDVGFAMPGVHWSQVGLHHQYAQLGSVINPAGTKGINRDSFTRTLKIRAMGWMTKPYTTCFLMATVVFFSLSVLPWFSSHMSRSTPRGLAKGPQPDW